ncbi:MAG: methyltransferase [Deltaproteobacteria bacterium]|nr:methyltransferase [Deltaproteobacteria bacterium]MBW2415287.1 methyltransferase [Deltaproteobacteria bacterium]
MDVEKLREDVIVETELRGHPFRLRSTWGLFSPRDVDEGSRLLLRYVRVEPDDDCLDLGCGYGAIGLTLARCAPQGRTRLVDKDFVAVDYARRNARENGVKNAVAKLSNGFSGVEDLQFDLVAANLPAKTGKELLYLLLHDAHAHLSPGGALWVVTISGLRRFIERGMREVFGNYEKVKQGRTHTVACAVREA